MNEVRSVFPDGAEYLKVGNGDIRKGTVAAFIQNVVILSDIAASREKKALALEVLKELLPDIALANLHAHIEWQNKDIQAMINTALETNAYLSHQASAQDVVARRQKLMERGGILPSSLLPENEDGTVIKGIKVRKGTIATALKCAESLSEYLDDYDRLRITQTLKDLADALVALDTHRHFTWNNAEIQTIVNEAIHLVDTKQAVQQTSMPTP